MGAPAEIAEFDIPRVTAHDEDVFWFDIAMDHVPLLTEIESRHHLLHNFPGCTFVKTPYPPQFLVEVALRSILEHRVYVVLVVEVSIELSNIWVRRESVLYLQLLPHLRIKIVFV